MIFPPAVLEQHIGVLGKTGSGKTSTGKLIVEQVVAAGSRVCVLDPVKSDWWGLVSSADGKKPGLPFHILGGAHGHVPLHSGAGAAIAELVARPDGLRHCIIDMKEFEPGGQHRFFTDFAPMLLKRMKGVLYLVMEEAHEFAPKERAGFGKENMSIHYAKQIATAGRSAGIRLIVLTQRTQSLHNALLSSVETMVVHRITKPEDQKPVVGWLKGNVKDKALCATITDSIGSIKTGSGWLCSAEAGLFDLVKFPRIATFDNSATPTDDVHEKRVHTGAVDLEALRALIGSAVHEAEANDPKKLRDEIQRLNSALKVAYTKTGDDTDRANLHHEIQLRDAEIDRLNEQFKPVAEANAMLARENERLRAAVDVGRTALRATIDSIEERLSEWPSTVPPEPSQWSTTVFKQAEAAVTTPYRFGSQKQEDAVNRQRSRMLSSIGKGVQQILNGQGKAPVLTGGKLTTPQQRILDSLAWWVAVGVDEPEDAAVAAMAKYAAGGGSYRNRKGELRAMGLIDYPRDGFIKLTAEGRERVTVPRITHTLELHERVLERLTVPQRRILVPLLRAYPDSLADADLAAAADYEPGGGSYRNRKGELRGMGLIEYPQRGVIAARDILFPRAH